MSQEIDQRVVEMRFDNAQFEKNSRDTMRTLDKLKEKLSFKGAAKGLEQVQAASENVDFSGMEKGLDTVQAKFSALDVIAFTALQRITDKVISAGEQMVKSLSVDQITSGWDKYNEKTSNVQTIMNATGKSIDQVNGYLNKLMWYSDETSYSFSEMTSALSQMTAAGGKIDKMIPMIMGIANATADAGKIGFAFQSTIRNLTQSYSAGHLQLQDWKSLNLMGTATKALKQELIDTAVELGVIKEGKVTIASFESSLQKKWANTKVMEKTFAKYASMMEAAYELTQKNPGMTSSEALEQLKGQYGELAERAALAAQQATSFGQAIDSTKDAVSSKWMSVFETIFGNKEEATDTWTELANRLYDIFVPSIDALKDRMKEGLDSGWQQMRDAFGDQADAYTTVLEKLALAKGAVTEETIEKEGSFAKALQKGKVNAELLTTSLSDTIKTYAELLETMDEADPRYTYIDATEGIESTELVYFFQTRQHRLSLEEVKMPVALMAGNFIGSVWNSKLTVTLGVRRKGSTVLLAAVVWKGMVNDYYGKTVTVGGAMKAALEPNTSYEFVLTGETEGFLVGNDSIRLLGTVTHDGEEKPNESSYVQLKAGSTELKEGTGIRTWFGGTMSFYAGDGAVLTPEKTVNIGTMDATLNRSGRTVVVQADEAVMVSVEYRPAFL